MAGCAPRNAYCEPYFQTSKTEVIEYTCCSTTLCNGYAQIVSQTNYTCSYGLVKDQSETLVCIRLILFLSQMSLGALNYYYYLNRCCPYRICLCRVLLNASIRIVILWPVATIRLLTAQLQVTILVE